MDSEDIKYIDSKFEKLEPALDQIVANKTNISWLMKFQWLIVAGGASGFIGLIFWVIRINMK